MNKCIILAVILVFIGTDVRGQDQASWSLEECIQFAIEQSLLVEQAEINLETSKVNQKQAKQSRWPNLSASAGAGVNVGRVINPSTNTFETDDSYFNNFGISSGLPLYAGNQVNNTIKQAQVDLEATTEDLKQTRVDLAFNVSTAFLNVLFAEENTRNAEVSLELSQQQLEQIDKLIAAGTRPENERYDILAQISLDEQNLVRFQNDIILNELALKQLMRLEPDYELQLERPDIDEDILSRIDTYSFDQVYEAALQTQPQIKAQQLRIESAILGEKLAKGARFPSLSMGASAVTNWTNLDQFVSATETVRTDPALLYVNDVPVEVTQDVDIPTEFETTAYGTQFTDNLGFGVSLSLRIPIYSNYQLKADQERSKLNVLRAKNQDELVKQDLKTNIQNALSSAYAAREALEASEAAFDAAEVAYDNSERRFDLGALNSYDLIQARNRLDAARVNVTLAKFDYVFRILVLEYYLGRGVTYE